MALDYARRRVAAVHASIASLMRLRVSGRLRRRFPVALAMAFGYRGGGRALLGLASAKERLAGTVEDVNVDTLRTALKRRIG